ncbi:hypothetical protein Noda2021_04410 [Candidatus Dependentiae bacterium Noda2021]|nr:hypothetical protein Noda2021_04410 [Candidatus Dependentiae bacterium Noda2021]
MKLQKKLLRVLSTSYFIAALCYAEQAVVVKPVVDLIGSPIAEFFPNLETTKAYEEIPLCGAQRNAWNNCPRLHQLLFNEVIEVLEEKNNEVKIKVPDIFYINCQGKEKHNVFWTLKNNLKTFSHLNKIGINTIQFPGLQTKQNTITLVKPFAVLKTGTTYSAGTRFVVEQISDTNAIACIYNPELNVIEKTIIPRSFFVVSGKCPQQKMDLFVNIVKNWSNAQYIPYVWGGCSFVTTHEKAFESDGKSFGRSSCAAIKNGFDCAGLVLRAAKIAGLDYPYKNTTTLKEFLPALTNTDVVKNGDLIWIPGHVMIVSDAHRNKLIEARSYPHGYGIVHEIELEKVFKDIKTFAQLLSASTEKKLLYRLDDAQQIRDTIKECRLLRLDK